MGTQLPAEPVAASCAEPTHVAERTLAADEVLVYAPVSGQWSVAPRSTLTGDSTWWSAGVLHRGRTPLGPASIESLRLADVTYDASPHHEAPCATSWVRVLSADLPTHARLSDVPAGTLVAYAGRLLRTGEGTVQPTGEVLSRVVDTFSRTAEGVFELEVELPDGSLTWLSATAEHPFYAVASGKYVSVRHLEVGSRLHVEGGGDALLVSKTWRQGGVEVFNVEVAGEHNYFAAGVLTHNAGQPCEPDLPDLCVPGPFAGGSIPARGPGRNFTAQERRDVNKLGNTFGCHSCGAEISGYRSGNWVLDHQPVSILLELSNMVGAPQVLLPQCRRCSCRQGGYASGRKRRGR